MGWYRSLSSAQWCCNMSLLRCPTHPTPAESGQSSGLALKLCKPRLAARRSLAHEWRMFKDLRLLGERRPGLKECFLQVWGGGGGRRLAMMLTRFQGDVDVHMHPW